MAVSCLAHFTRNLATKCFLARAQILAIAHEGFEGFSGEGGLDDQPGGGGAAWRGAKLVDGARPPRGCSTATAEPASANTAPRSKGGRFDGSARTLRELMLLLEAGGSHCRCGQRSRIGRFAVRERLTGNGASALRV